MTGLWTEVCITWPTIEMLGAGYNVYVVEDCCGATSPAAQEAALSRMVQAGAVRLTTIAALLEWQRDWKNNEHYNALMGILKQQAALTASASNTPTRWFITRRSRRRNRKSCRRRPRTELESPGRRGRPRSPAPAFPCVDFGSSCFAAMCPLAPGAERPAFQTLRYNEDWSFLARLVASARIGSTPVKFIPLDGTNVYVSFGGEARLKYERYDEPVFNQKPADDDGFLLQRYLVHADLHATPYLRVFGQLQSSLEDFRNGGPRPTDRDDLDLHQAFFDAARAAG